MFARYGLLVALALLCGCTNSRDRPQQPDSRNRPKDGKDKLAGRPFMEHPSGGFETAVDAMADAIKRLRALPELKDWITFSAHGMGDRDDSYHFAAIRMRQDELKFDKPIDLDINLVTKRAGVPQSCLATSGEGYTVAKATPVQAARIMDVIYRNYLGIRPHAG